jgi:hypothetical protein
MQRKLEEEREIQKTALGIYRDYKTETWQQSIQDKPFRFFSAKSGPF